MQVAAKHDFSKVDKDVAAAGKGDDYSQLDGASDDVDSMVSSRVRALGGLGQESASKAKRRLSTSRLNFMSSPFGKGADESKKKTPSMTGAESLDAPAGAGRKSSERQNPKPRGRKPKSEMKDVSSNGPSGTIGSGREEEGEDEEKTWGNLKQRLESKKREKMQKQQPGATAGGGSGTSESGSVSGSASGKSKKSSAVRRPSLGQSQGSLGEEEEFQRMHASYVQDDISRGDGGGVGATSNSGGGGNKKQHLPTLIAGGIAMATHDEQVGVLGSERDDAESNAGDGWADDFTGGRDTGTAAAAATASSTGAGKKKSSFEFGSIASSMVGKSALAQRLEAKEAKEKDEGENRSSKRRSSIGNGAASMAKGLLSSLVMTQV